MLLGCLVPLVLSTFNVWLVFTSFGQVGRGNGLSVPAIQDSPFVMFRMARHRKARATTSAGAVACQMANAAHLT